MGKKTRKNTSVGTPMGSGRIQGASAAHKTGGIFVYWLRSLWLLSFSVIVAKPHCVLIRVTCVGPSISSVAPPCVPCTYAFLGERARSYVQASRPVLIGRTYEIRYCLSRSGTLLSNDNAATGAPSSADVHIYPPWLTIQRRRCKHEDSLMLPVGAATRTMRGMARQERSAFDTEAGWIYGMFPSTSMLDRAEQSF
jgi:hypothetical protein